MLGKFDLNFSHRIVSDERKKEFNFSQDFLTSCVLGKDLLPHVELFEEIVEQIRTYPKA